MDLDRIRKMSDKDLEQYLTGLATAKNSKVCIKCKNLITDRTNRHTIYVAHGGGSPKVYVNLCSDCYEDFKKYMGTKE